METSVRSPASIGKELRASRAAGVNVRSIAWLSIELRHRCVEGDEEFLGMALREDQRRPDLHDVSVGAGIARQESPVLEAIDDLDRAVRIGRPRGVGPGDLDADEQ